jgi:hypothetical protein
MLTSHRHLRSLALANDRMILSRRGFVTALGAAVTAAASFACLPARAQDGPWREFRRDDLGFRIELPGEPMTETDDNDPSNPIARAFGAELEYEQMTFGVACLEYRERPLAGQHFASFRDGMKAAKMAATRESELSMNGFPAWEFIRESGDLNFIWRWVIMGNLVVGAEAVGNPGMHSDPTARRVIDSFKLLRNAP